MVLKFKASIRKALASNFPPLISCKIVSLVAYLAAATSSMQWLWILLGVIGGVVVLAAVAVIIIVLLKKKGKKGSAA